ncbi:hypothetical protein K435DRAFT_777321 [Dendrothele bispora CBS 962.96]|uniref:DUF7704 domain-containing protein n=1 Tax=Dendrothele bispora (strain CBS 962.96) TaxID=1314807 RepID=A0A4S8M8G4_DENBC|nr:hypothetical protein K435DRAFT_777321 [Dendrothele bispora CBS 962.96]
MSSTDISSIPFLYKAFFLYIEPISALAGAYYAFFQPTSYLKDLTLPKEAAQPLDNAGAPLVPSITLSPPITASLFQLANLYLLFALNEHLVLSSTNSLKTWKRLLFCLLIADFGHLATLVPLVASGTEGTASTGLTGLGWDLFYRFWDWNAMMWGSIGFVYVGASMRMSFLMGLGLGLGVDAEGPGREVGEGKRKKEKKI